MTTFTITVQDQAVSEMLAKLSARVGNMAPYLQSLGEDIVERTKQRFDTSTAPDGNGWAAYSPVTLGLMRKRGKTPGKLLVDTGTALFAHHCAGGFVSAGKSANSRYLAVVPHPRPVSTNTNTHPMHRKRP